MEKIRQALDDEHAMGREEHAMRLSMRDKGRHPSDFLLGPGSPRIKLREALDPEIQKLFVKINTFKAEIQTELEKAKHALGNLSDWNSDVDSTVKQLASFKEQLNNIRKAEIEARVLIENAPDKPYTRGLLSKENQQKITALEELCIQANTYASELKSTAEKLTLLTQVLPPSKN